MKKILIIILMISNFKCFSQELNGKLLYTNNCKFTDSVGYTVQSSQRYEFTKVKLNNNELIIKGQKINLRYELFDKQVDSTNGIVINYISTSHGKLSMIGVKECENKNIKIGIFSLEGDNKFVEYIFKLIE